MAVTAALVKELRERTGAGMLDCKKALVETDGDIELAIENMRKSGQAKAAKKAGRIAAEGVILTKVEAGRATMLELNCETDFVARDEGFLKFGNELLEVAAANNINDIEALNDADMNGVKVSEARDALVAKIGENISPRRVINVEGDTLGAYVHGGRIGVISILTGGDEELAKDVAMHVAAASPQFVKPENVPAEVVEKEKEIQIEIAIQSGKPADIAEKMVAGRMKKFTGEVSLTGQPFVKDPSISVAELLKNNSADVINFVRFEVGEGIEKKTEDFAAEVAAQMAAAKK
ncbi:translation elongation factor Ts [Alteromonas macleodii]|jgi:elongation factor Ts|uniref:Elongation factor Ts n=3 Tax=Alteromonas TaxID=226 RepID=A0A0B3Y047_9ALTE|nr:MULTISPECIES: translation elongation factor Ts [Alteromonas]AFT77500.1 elongation factor Ts [Alteromonas macleodii str. 'Black Sea 11']MAL72695.1 elongation factor Ts [Alteromonas sp.]MEC7284554.1 translation elongation factor Ts [Pseudomonadota bacterium]NKW87986.1 elongation factor Ts [Alteromonadaceae bacterium A_SAG4]NKX04059.1 elongation factor Ts [Alteromonadaceae bacterium A_SAG6]NKX34143.1 elongation factor Ts [Alteromonadaceae bacterium A_SAG3]|tara:strand:- start:2999 stop:3871 length:873 start_codon:yes stop_codon:yes gene_type:complete|mmetsp:Transcript_143296/g.445416  ORF Transcript_143296/g.445416 Transcript_143296/m.445416 type:complete len:291 (-) Transcript_143296:49-921(-)